MAYRNQQPEKLLGDLRNSVSQLEALLRDSASDAGEGLSDMKERMRERFDAARDSFTDFERDAAERARNAAWATDEYVREHTWTTIGAAAALGALIGFLLNMRR